MVRSDPTSQADATPRPIFMVDDDDVDRMLFERLLREAGIPNSARAFSCGEHIIDALLPVFRGAPAPLVCFLDVKMSGMNGFDVLRWIRCQRNLDDVAAVMLSSSEQPGDLNEARHFGAQCYLAKFPTADQLREIVKEAERMAAAAAAGAFNLPGNLLTEMPQAIC